MPSVWHRFFGRSVQARSRFIDALNATGFVAHDWDRAPAEASGGIVFFDGPGQPVLDFLRDESRHGSRRVLAVAVDPIALEHGMAFALLGAGASDALAWSRTCPTEIAARFERWAEVDRLVESAAVRSTAIGASPAWKSALRQIVEVARFTDASVLVTGESGTGKELAARLVHALEPRSGKGELVLLDCTTIVPELSGSEFFGHEKGAYTGAVVPRDGAFARADGGCLFLDEVGDLPLPLQAQLLRVVQERSYKRIGGNTWQSTKFRLVCATNRDLQAEEANGRFRRDFYYRIAGASIRLPPLRERMGDVPLLARAFLARLDPRGEAPDLDPAVESWLLGRDYPGNVRDLKQIVTRIWSRHVGPGPITPGDIPHEDRPRADAPIDDWHGERLESVVRAALASGAGMKDIGRAAEAAAERIAIEEAEGNLPRAARRLGVSDRALQMRRAARRNVPPQRQEMAT